MKIHEGSLHEIIGGSTKVIQRFLVDSRVKPARQEKSQLISNHSIHETQNTHLDETFAPAKPGFDVVFGFFLPLALSLASFCSSFASVVSPLATLRTSTSFKGMDRARA